MKNKTKTSTPSAPKVASKRGRPVLGTSARQMRLKRFSEIVAAGGEVKRGRPKSATPKATKPKAIKTAKKITQPNAPTIPSQGETVMA
jgi:hypothetical protein